MGPHHTDCHEINVSNIQDGEILSYSLPLIKGHIYTRNGIDCNINKIILEHYNATGNLQSTTEWPVTNGEFKLLVDLSPEKNTLILKYCTYTHQLNVTYRPRATVLRVTPVYIICQGHDGCFQSPDGTDNSVVSACARIGLGARLIQTLTAEKLYEAKRGHRTFQLERDLCTSGKDCQVFHSELPAEEARKMGPRELWASFGRELMSSPLGSNDRKFLAFLSCTRYNPPQNKPPPKMHEDVLAATEAYVALGGGGLAIFGSACLYTWPLQVESVLPCFLDATKVDIRNFMDDSCYRGTFGGCFATTLGSVCHELGHTFDLGHTPDGIMGRDFDNINLVFTVERNRVCGKKEPAQHSVVSLTKILDVFYTIEREPIKSRSLESLQRTPSNSTSSLNATCINGNKIENKCLRSSERGFDKPVSMSSKIGENAVRWSKSCGVLLSFHSGVSEFIVPSEALSKPSLTLVAEDSSGNLIKHQMT
ncbi:hypothetical protein C0J52_18854 [Blattella germanica]|nr:hypothetical protein C0J52_18854 [Blattella germanica]